jgi:ribosomal protein S18 acetylase RimI-like enzyme
MSAPAVLTAEQLEAEIGDFAELIHACVHAGASVNFYLPFPLADAERFWRRKVLPGLGAGTLLVLGLRDGGRLAGTVQLDCDTPPNQLHRAEVRKLLVHPDFRRRGHARTLMLALEAAAAERKRSLLTLDTRTGDPAGDLYRSLGYQTVGIIPGFSRDPIEDGVLNSTTLMYKQL